MLRSERVRHVLRSQSLCNILCRYPHIKLHVKDGAAWSVRDYDGEHTADALELLCGRLSSPTFTAISDASVLELQSAAFAIDSRADAADMALFRSAAEDLYHVSSRLLSIPCVKL